MPIPPPPQDSLTPRRQASQKMVEAGLEYLEADKISAAIQTLQEGANIDPNNGHAYYFLGLALYRNHQFEDALGVLDRAEVLLESYPQELDQVLLLKSHVLEAKLQEADKKNETKKGYL